MTLQEAIENLIEINNLLERRLQQAGENHDENRSAVNQSYSNAQFIKDQLYIKKRLDVILENLQNAADSDWIGGTYVVSARVEMLVRFDSSFAQSKINRNWIIQLDDAVGDMRKKFQFPRDKGKREDWIDQQTAENQPKMRKLLDGETITKITSDLTALLSLALFIATVIYSSVKKPGSEIFDKVGFLSMGISAAVAILVSLVARIINGIIQKKCRELPTKTPTEEPSEHKTRAKGQGRTLFRPAASISEWKERRSKEKAERRQQKVGLLAVLQYVVSVPTLLFSILSIVFIGMGERMPLSGNHWWTLYIIGYVAAGVFAIAMFILTVVRAKEDYQVGDFWSGDGHYGWISAICMGLGAFLIWEGSTFDNWARWLFVAFGGAEALFGAGVLIFKCFAYGLERKVRSQIAMVLTFSLFACSVCSGGLFMVWHNAGKNAFVVFQQNSDGTYTYMLGAQCEGDALVIPEEYKGNPVTKVAKSSMGKGALAKLKSIYIPESVTEMDEALLSGCGNLESLTVPFIGYAGRWGVTDEAVYIGDVEGAQSLGWLFGDQEYKGGIAISRVDSGTYVTGDKKGESSRSSHTSYIPATLKTLTVLGGDLCDYACAEFKNITTVILGENVKSIGQHAFANCEGLTSITIPESVIRIGYLAFEGADQVSRNINGVTYVDNWAIACDATVTHVEFSDDTIGIAEVFLHGIKNEEITEVIIPKSVIHIGAFAFLLSHKFLKSVIFEDTAGWSAGGTPISDALLSNPTKAAELLISAKTFELWTKTTENSTTI